MRSTIKCSDIPGGNPQNDKVTEIKTAFLLLSVLDSFCTMMIVYSVNVVTVYAAEAEGLLEERRYAVHSYNHLRSRKCPKFFGNIEKQAFSGHDFS